MHRTARQAVAQACRQAVHMLPTALSMARPTRLPPDPIDLPHGLSASAPARRRAGTCPRCGEAQLFRKWLKPVDACPHCGQDWSVQQADDFPAYIAIFVAGHLLAPRRDRDDRRPSACRPGLTLAIILPLAVALMLVMLQPAKGAVIAFLWWLGHRRLPAGAPRGRAENQP